MNHGQRQAAALHRHSLLLSSDAVVQELQKSLRAPCTKSHILYGLEQSKHWFYPPGLTNEWETEPQVSLLYGTTALIDIKRKHSAKRSHSSLSPFLFPCFLITAAALSFHPWHAAALPLPFARFLSSPYSNLSKRVLKEGFYSQFEDCLSSHNDASFTFSEERVMRFLLRPHELAAHICRHNAAGEFLDFMQL